ncbi:MAG: hypothetical protein ACFB15_21840 [Cyclobacteriaceae bacterium]
MRKYYWGIIMVLLMLVSCSKKAEYENWVDQELSSGVRKDSLFLGLELGMTSKNFYAHCWELNKQGLIRQGLENTSVEYKLDDELKHPATMNFYPNFHSDKIHEMPVTFKYTAWAPWNEQLQAGSLQLDVLQLMQKWYGEKFMDVSHPIHGTAYVRIDGNRRISIFKKNESDVMVMFTDLTVEKKKETSR